MFVFFLGYASETPPSKRKFGTDAKSRRRGSGQIVNYTMWNSDFIRLRDVIIYLFNNLTVPFVVKLFSILQEVTDEVKGTDEVPMKKRVPTK